MPLAQPIPRAQSFASMAAQMSGLEPSKSAATAGAAATHSVAAIDPRCRRVGRETTAARSLLHRDFDTADAHVERQAGTLRLGLDDDAIGVLEGRCALALDDRRADADGGVSAGEVFDLGQVKDVAHACDVGGAHAAEAGALQSERIVLAFEVQHAGAGSAAKDD